MMTEDLPAAASAETAPPYAVQIVFDNEHQLVVAMDIPERDRLIAEWADEAGAEYGIYTYLGANREPRRLAVNLAQIFYIA